MRRPVRLYLAGPAGVGKTKVAEGLASRYGFQRISLGDLVRELTVTHISVCRIVSKDFSPFPRIFPMI